MRAAVDSDEEIFPTQDTFSQEPFSPELNLEELLADFREVSERDSVEVEKKETPGRIIVVVCDNEVEQRRESRYRQTPELILLGRYAAGRNGPSNAM